MKSYQHLVRQGTTIFKFVSVSLPFVMLLFSVAVSVPPVLAGPSQTWTLKAKPTLMPEVASTVDSALTTHSLVGRMPMRRLAGSIDTTTTSFIPELLSTPNLTPTLEINVTTRIGSSYQVRMRINSADQLEELQGIGIDVQEIGDVITMIPVSSYEILRESDAVKCQIRNKPLLGCY